MAQFEAFEDDAEIDGQSIDSTLQGVGELSSVFETRMRETLAENGIEDPKPGEWYPRQVLDVTNEISDSIGPQTMMNIGKKIPETADWPPNVDTVEGGLESIDEAYQMNHRGGEIGYYKFEKVSGSKGDVFCKNPYPCDFDEGVVTAVAERFSSSEGIVSLEDQSEQCRKDGGDECIYRITWQ